jgi:hypothetical protein
LIPKLALRDACAYLNKHAQSYAFALLLYAPGDSGRDDQAVRCVIAARPDCGAADWEILYERLDARSFALSLSRAIGQYLASVTTMPVRRYMMRQSFDDYNETCQMIDGSTAIHPHNLGLLMLHGGSSY